MSIFFAYGALKNRKNPCGKGVQLYSSEEEAKCVMLLFMSRPVVPSSSLAHSRVAASMPSMPWLCAAASMPWLCAAPRTYETPPSPPFCTVAPYRNTPWKVPALIIEFCSYRYSSYTHCHYSILCRTVLNGWKNKHCAIAVKCDRWENWESI